MSITLISIGNKWPNSRIPWDKRGSRGGKPVRTLYYLDDTGTLRTRKISKIEEILLKPKIPKRKVFVCLTCRRRSVLIVNNKDDVIPCEYCDT